MKINKAIAVAFIICIFGIFIISCSPLASIKNNITSKESSKSQVVFEVKASNKVNFTYDSSVIEGTLKLQLIDGDGKVIENFQTNKKGLEQVSLEKAGEYTLLAAYDNFIGNYKISVNR
ncbi:hypothetical protein [Clostridium pasteurianum]|uniref:Uncharacterized protein n=1 Tax=Clostridium pasteurianum BC1 TaxID=86416 RepID=R4K7Q2_CLOPA|nr:hypothetical protein [Clostridium pasteurianum]AGK95675.1 hypothetical protein Clopa_0630 [Clostridium pasteurianum BC1]